MVSIYTHLRLYAFLIICFTLGISNGFTQVTGNLSGRIVDATTQTPLAYASVFVEGTNIGTTSDVEGKFRLFNIPVGIQTVKSTYLGYQEFTQEVEINRNQTTDMVVSLVSKDISTDEVVITAQLKGQRAAINQQINSNTIVNVISQEKIQELPDQNAAESLGRLPGISVLRDAGEGTKVVVRGLSPRFNAITVNGVRVPSTDPQDRSVDLTMVSTDALQGIEVYKALTPDRDGDAVGGSINFVTKTAEEGFHGNARLLYGYNDHEEEFGQWRGDFNLSNRFFDDRLGVIVAGNYQRVNRSSDVLDAGYIQNGIDNEGRSIMELNNLNLEDNKEVRYRYGGSVSIDYPFLKGELQLTSFLGRTDREQLRRRRRYRVGAAYQELDARDRTIEQFLSTNTFRGNYNFNFLNMELSWLTSYSVTQRDVPVSHFARFRELGAFTGDLIEDRGPEVVPEGAKNNLDETYFHDASKDLDDIRDRNVTAQIDLKFPFSTGENFNGYFKTGVKVRDKNRSRDVNTIWTAFGGINDVIDAFPDAFEMDSRGRISVYNFLGPFVAPDFLEDQYEFGTGLNVETLNEFGETYGEFYMPDPQTDLRDYNASEQVRSAYAMAEFHFFNQKLMFLPGVRVEETTNEYGSVFGTPTTGGFVSGIRDTSGVRTYTEVLPMFHLRYKATNWFDIRLATTKSLSRPDYFNLVPWQRIDHFEGVVEEGAPNLLHTQVWNYDVFLSFYNTYGLFTLGGFYKTLQNIDYIRTSRITDTGPTRGYDYIRPVNAELDANAYGIEIDLQGSLQFLPKPFDGIVLSANYSYIQAEALYPFFQVGPERIPEPPYTPVVIDTFRVGRVPGQANQIFNLSIGYEKKGFSGRISMVYQGESLGTVGRREEEDGFTDAFQRWDLQVQQKLGDTGFSIILNLNNLTNTPQRTSLGIGFPTREEYFGWTGDLGLRYRF